MDKAPSKKPDEKPPNPASSANEGEGSRSGARDYDQRTEAFVRSGKVEENAKKAEKAVDSPEGKELAEGIRADADRQKRVILAEAYREAEETRGDGDAKAAEIYAKAYAQDAEFYAFYRSLQAYRESFSDKRDVLVLDPKSDFFRYLEKAKQ